MMIEYVLLFMIMDRYNEAGAGLSHTFNNKPACERAARDFLKQPQQEFVFGESKGWRRGPRIGIEKSKTTILADKKHFWICVPKG